MIGNLAKVGADPNKLVKISVDMFFNKAAVIEKMDKKTHRAMSNALAYARGAMRKGMRRRKKVSEVNAFPSAHEGTLKERILFGYDENTKSGVVGPTFWRPDRELNTTKTVPELINDGGTVTRTRMFGHRRKVMAPPVQQTYRPRPFVKLTAPIAAKRLAEQMEKIDL